MANKAIRMHLNIGGHTYKVIVKNRIKDGIDNAGTVVVSENTIWINEDQCKTQQESTLLHEIIEAINITYDLRLKHSQITTLEVTLYQVLKDNNLLKGRLLK
jgi:hypothetical protein